MNQFNPFFMNSSWGWAFLLIAIWSLFWKGCALWIAAKNNKKGWFLALLILNTAGILEIVYIFYVAKKKWADIEELLSRDKTSVPPVQ
ncbi:MAG: DUF5652 family protein [Candidatus Paceibacterota bacterium]|jgi:hypothetical protein